MKKKILAVVGTLLGIAILFTAFMGYAHTKSGRPILAWMGRQLHKGAACPLGYDKVASVSDRAEFRKQLSARELSKSVAQSRVLLGFDFGHSNRAEIESWVALQKGFCHQLQSPTEIECGGPLFKSNDSTLWLEFDKDSKLVGARGIERFSSKDLARGFFTKTRQEILKAGTAGVTESGVSVEGVLDGGQLSQTVVSGQFNNFKVSSRLTRMGDIYAVTQDSISF